MGKVRLKELGIYRLPDGREFVVSESGRDAYSLYAPLAWKNFGLAEYRIHADGRLLSKGTLTRWRMEDLTYTGRMALPLQEQQSSQRGKS
jgi:hypothetical protein